MPIYSCLVFQCHDFISHIRVYTSEKGIYFSDPVSLIVCENLKLGVLLKPAIHVIRYFEHGNQKIRP